MSLAETLKKGLGPKIVRNYGPNSRVRLTEKQKQYSMTVEIDAEDWRVTTIRMPENCHPKFVTGKDWKMLCDYFLLCERGEEVQILLVELKRTLNSEHEGKAMEQLRRSLPLWSYLHAAAAVESESGISGAVKVGYAAIYLQTGERFPKEESPALTRCWSRDWRGIGVREVVATSVSLSELTGEPPFGKETNR